jgi:hypothetical protein
MYWEAKQGREYSTGNSRGKLLVCVSVYLCICVYLRDGFVRFVVTALLLDIDKNIRDDVLKKRKCHILLETIPSKLDLFVCTISSPFFSLSLSTPALTAKKCEKIP